MKERLFKSIFPFSFFQGVTVYGICNALRYLPELRPLAQKDELLILCQAKTATMESVEVTVVSSLGFVYRN